MPSVRVHTINVSTYHRHHALHGLAAAVSAEEAVGEVADLFLVIVIVNNSSSEVCKNHI